MRLNKSFLFIFLFILILLVYALFITKVGFADSAEYINVARELVGISNTNIFIMHDLLYGFYLALFLHIIKSLVILKIANIIWPILVAILFYFCEDRKVLLLWITSPLVHWTSIQISPLVAVTFFVALTYITYKRYEDTCKKGYLLLTGLSLGLAISLRYDLFVIMIIFILCFFFNKSFKEVLLFILFLIPTLMIRFFLDYIYFKIPFYTILTSFGTAYFNNLKVIPSPYSVNWFLILIIIAPLSFLIYKTDMKMFKREIIFLFLALLFYLPNLVFYYNTAQQLRLLLVISPIVIILLSRVITKRQLFVNIVLSFVLIGVFVYPSFVSGNENELVKDLNEIHEELSIEYAITAGGAYIFPVVNVDYWNEKGPHYIWGRDYALFLENKTVYRQIELESKPKIKYIDKIIEIQINTKQNRDLTLLQDIEDMYFVLNKEEFLYDKNKNQLVVTWPSTFTVDNITLIKCYTVLCVFKKD